MKKIYKKLKLLVWLLFRKQFIVVYFPAHEETEWQSFGLEIEQIGDACDVVLESIMDVIQDYVDCDNSEEIGQQMINHINLN